MRVSTRQMHLQGLDAMLRNQAALSRTQNQLASGQRLLSAADAPADAAQALSLDALLSKNQSYLSAIGTARGRLSIEESTLAGVGDSLQHVRELALQANNATQSPESRANIATQMQSQLEHLLSMANSTDGEGRYLFAGTTSASPPFTLTPTGATYAGDAQQRVLQIGDQRTLADGDPGSAVFGAPADLFATVTQLINDVNGLPASSASFNTSLTNLDSVLGHVTDVRAGVGTRLAALDDAQNDLEGRQLSLQDSLSGLRDLDYAEATTRLNLQMTALQAAQASYSRIQGLSLFDYLR
jgi:flagellar hook-associated protein 3 FlgL